MFTASQFNFANISITEGRIYLKFSTYANTIFIDHHKNFIKIRARIGAQESRTLARKFYHVRLRFRQTIAGLAKLVLYALIGGLRATK